MHIIQRAIDDNKDDGLRWRKMKRKGIVSTTFSCPVLFLKYSELPGSKSSYFCVSKYSVSSDIRTINEQDISLYQILQFSHFLPLFEKMKHDQVFLTNPERCSFKAYL